MSKLSEKSAWLSYSPEQLTEVEEFAKAYEDFISTCKTERICTEQSIKLAEKYGYKDIAGYIDNNTALKAGDKVYYNMKGKALALFHIGTEPLEKGMNILGAHIDSPRIDAKPHPLYEKDGFCLLDTHYYGGIKQYQWTAMPLALYGVVYLKDGRKVDIAIGDREGEEVFVISDLLIHLSREQMSKTLDKAIASEDLDVIFGSIPQKDVKKNPVEANILKLLKEEYGIDKEDFVTAELEFVPAGKARDCGLDRSMVLGYGQDDRVCAYTSLMAMLETSSEPVKRTTACLLVDKEEIGSMGNTGMQSRFFENQVAEVLNLLGGYSELKVRRALQNSRMLSNDVTAAHDPIYSSVSAPNGNMAVFGGGVALGKYTGSRGKSGSNDASAEYLAKLRKILDDNQIFWQIAELGKVDAGGGGTIAYITANYGMEVIDAGVPLLNMHAPFELSSKADIYETLKFNKVFLSEMD